MSLVVALFLVPTLAALEWGDDAEAADDGALGALLTPGALRNTIAFSLKAPWVSLRSGFSWMNERKLRFVFLPYFFLRLPNSTLEMDLPLIGYYPLTEQPDEGLMPDVYVEPNVDDVINGIDTELEAVKALIVR